MYCVVYIIRCAVLSVKCAVFINRLQCTVIVCRECENPALYGTGNRPCKAANRGHCTVLFCIRLYCTKLHCTILYYTILYCTIL